MHVANEGRLYGVNYGFILKVHGLLIFSSNGLSFQGKKILKKEREGKTRIQLELRRKEPLSCKLASHYHASRGKSGIKRQSFMRSYGGEVERYRSKQWHKKKP